MAGTVQASLTAALKTSAWPQLQESVFYNKEWIGNFERVRPTSDDDMRVKHHSGANSTIGTYSEGDAIGVAGSETYTTATWDCTYFKGVFSVTGHARDALNNDSSEAAFFPQISMQLTSLLDGLVDLAVTRMLGSATSGCLGIQTIVDSTGTVAGIDRSSDTWFASYEVDTAGSAYALTDLDIVWQNVHDAEYASPGIDSIFTSYKQIRLAKADLNPSVSTGTLPAGGFGTSYNLGVPLSGFSYAGANIYGIRELTNTIWLFMVRNEHKIIVLRDWKVDELGKTDDSDKFLVTGAFGQMNLNPKHCAKLIGA